MRVANLNIKLGVRDQMNRREIKKNYISHFLGEINKRYPDSGWCAVTLTMRQGIPLKGGGIEMLNRREVSKCISVLMKQLNKKTYNHAYQRYGKKLACIPVIEVSSNDRLHVHMLLQIPKHVQSNYHEYFDLIKKLWMTLRWAHREEHDVKLLPTKDDVTGWTKYIAKDLYSENDVIDLDNVHLGPIAVPD